MGDKTVSTYYIKNLPKTDDRKPSLSELKLKKMNYERFNAANVPKDIDELKQLRRRELAVEFMTRYAAGTVKSKNAYIKEKHISINTLNKALSEAGNTVKTVIPRKSKAKPKSRPRCEVKAGSLEGRQDSLQDDVKSTSTLLKDVLKLNSNRKKENKREKNNSIEEEIPA